MQGGIDSKGLFHSYIMVWVQDMQLNLLDQCKAEKVNLFLPLSLVLLMISIFTMLSIKLLSLINNNKSLLQVPWAGVTTNHSTSPFAEEMYEKIKDSLVEYEVVINRWPQYSLILENVSFVHGKVCSAFLC